MKSGYDIPALGLGTGELTGERCVRAVRTALELGYRHLDTAELYRNHQAVGEAIRGFDRSHLFLTSKVPAERLRHDDVLAACDQALEELAADYLDLYLIHWPSKEVPMEETFRALGRLHEQGLVRSIGVSNFSIERLRRALAISQVPISANQFELHPLLYQRKLVEFCQANGVVVIAYSPVARNRVAEYQVIRQIAAEHAKTPAQVSLRWLMHKGVAAVPRSGSEQHLRENLSLFDWELTPDQERALDRIDAHVRIIAPRDFDEFDYT